MKKLNIILALAISFTAPAFACHKGEKGKEKQGDKASHEKAVKGERADKNAKNDGSENQASKTTLIGDTNKDGELDEKEIAALNAEAEKQDKQDKKDKIVSQVHVGKPHGIVRFYNGPQLNKAQQKALVAKMKAANDDAAEKSKQAADKQKPKHTKAVVKSVAKV